VVVPSLFAGTEVALLLPLLGSPLRPTPDVPKRAWCAWSNSSHVASADSPGGTPSELIIGAVPVVWTFLLSMLLFR